MSGRASTRSSDLNCTLTDQRHTKRCACYAMGNLYRRRIIETELMLFRKGAVRPESRSAFQTRVLDTKRLLSFRGVLCVSLACLVFVWGTNYKLSLYKAKQENSPAKVCTRGSDAAKSVLEQATDERNVAQTFVRMTGLMDLLRGIGDHRLDRLRNQEAGTVSLLRLCSILYFRPPPDEQRSVT
jgi:hypothetical protein